MWSGLNQNSNTDGYVFTCHASLPLLFRIQVGRLARTVTSPYSPERFYTILAAGFMPTPYIWAEKAEFEYAMKWRTKPYQGGVWAVDEEGNTLTAEQIIVEAVSHIPEVEYRLKQQ